MNRRVAVLLIFTLSGAAGLIYEIVWSRQLVLVFGNTTQAVSAILTGFFGGMAIGAAVGGRIADRVRSPLRMYGILEIVLVVVVLVTPITFRLIHEVYRGVYPALEGSPQLLALVRMVLAVLALGPATVMMGATFPALTRHLTASASLSRSFGRLYAANTFGAIAGTLVAGIVLIELLGLAGALAVGAGCSLIAGLAAIWLARDATVSESPVAAPEAAVAAPTPTGTPMPAPDSASAPVRTGIPASGRVRLALGIAFVSGLTSLGYQITWTRLLASGTGNTTYVFTVILATFLIGIAFGAMLYNILGPRLRDPIRLLAATQILVAALAIGGLVLVIGGSQPLAASSLIDAVRLLYGSVLLVVLPVTVVLGLAFPTASTLLRDAAEEAGTESGALLSVNTVGAIIGSFIVPFLLMPTIGSPAVIVVLATINACLGIGLALASRPRAMGSALAGAATLAMIAILAVRPGLVVQPSESVIRAVGGAIFASTEDEIASVQAGQIHATPQLWVAGTSMTLLTVDAKLMPILPLMARPDAQRALVVAFGMGTSFRSALVAGLRTDVIELVPSVPAMFGFFHDDADRVLADPNGRVIVTDGRNHLELTDDRFDIIVTDPPPPIESSGASVISSLEYYVAGREHLAPGGVMMQWVPYGAPESEYKEHVRTFASVFPNVTVVRGPGNYGTYMLGSADPVALEEGVVRQILERPGVLEDLSSAFDSPATTVDGWIDVIREQTWLEGDEVAAYVGDGPLITDDRPRPEYFLLRRMGAGTLEP